MENLSRISPAIPTHPDSIARITSINSETTPFALIRCQPLWTIELNKTVNLTVILLSCAEKILKQLTDTGYDSKFVHRRKRPIVDTLFSSFFFRRVRATSMTQRRVENTRVPFWTFSPVSVKQLITRTLRIKSNWEPNTVVINFFTGREEMWPACMAKKWKWVRVWGNITSDSGVGIPVPRSAYV